MSEAVKKYQVNISNRDIHFKYEILEKIECGISLSGTEAKSVKDGKCNLKDSFAIIRNNAVVLKNMHISPYDKGNINNVNPTRDRILLLNKNEILKLLNYVKQGGYTLIPSKIYTKGRWLKTELCVCKGKKLYDKREAIKKRQDERQMNAFKMQDIR
ncbi:MAG: SsrA-binding protein SmpB [Clostridia bacterium]|nr:SsrA-binding protein SmpB [Clostridia bacterium]